jgi:hypothetical protein
MQTAAVQSASGKCVQAPPSVETARPAGAPMLAQLE